MKTKRQGRGVTPWRCHRCALPVGRGWLLTWPALSLPHTLFRSPLPSTAVCRGSLHRSHVEREAELPVRPPGGTCPLRVGSLCSMQAPREDKTPNAFHLESRLMSLASAPLRGALGLVGLSPRLPFRGLLLVLCLLTHLQSSSHTRTHTLAHTRVHTHDFL